MNKDLQDLAWSVLPKEERQYCRNMYRTSHDGNVIDLLERLFGSACLPDEAEEAPVAPRFNVGDWVRCEDAIGIVKGHDDDDKSTLVEFIGDEPMTIWVDDKDLTPYDGPKFKVGQIAMFKGRRVEIIGYSDHFPQKYSVFVLTENYRTDAKESDLEPYTEPEEDRAEKIANKAIEPVEKHFGNILKDSDRNERRLNLAATIMGYIIQSGFYSLAENCREKNITEMAKLSMQLTDALIAECEKGGSDGN